MRRNTILETYHVRVPLLHRHDYRWVHNLEDKSLRKMILVEQKAFPIANWKRHAIVALVDTCLVSLKKHQVLALLGDEIHVCWSKFTMAKFLALLEHPFSPT